MTSEFSCDDAYSPQRSIYDERYKAGLYDHRSAVRVLTAERGALAGAVARTLISNPDARKISMFDFAYGTGRVTNEFIKEYAHQYAALRRDLLIVAYDVSSVGLRKAQDKLQSAGFTPKESFNWVPESRHGYIAGSLRKNYKNVDVTIVFIHGSEREAPEVMRRLALSANDGHRYLITMSWYSGLGHIPSEGLRREYFSQLNELTSPLGEIVLCLSATGDLVELQPEWSARLASGDVGDFPVAAPGDLVYQTELGQPNFYHIFGTDLNDYMEGITSTGQHWWIEGIRCPDEEFESAEAEQANYWRVRATNASKLGSRWNADDYREFHTVAALRSGVNPSGGVR
jgi:hypothetical protein